MERCDHQTNFFINGRMLLLQQLTRDFACRPLRQSVAENGRVPPQQLPRGRGDTPRRAVRLSPSALDNRQSTCCSRADCKNSDKRGKSPCICASLTSGKLMTPSTRAVMGCARTLRCTRDVNRYPPVPRRQASSRAYG